LLTPTVADMDGKSASVGRMEWRRTMAEQPNLWLSTEALHPGMILAEPVVSAGGMPLAPTGTTLTRRHLRQMRHWGIAGAEIAMPSAATQTTDSIPPSVINQWLALDDSDPFMHALAEIARDRYERHHYARQKEAAARTSEGSRP
jgi:hypothetical protein